MKRANEILPEVYRRGKKDYRDDQDLILSYWPTAVGPRVAAQTRPVRLFGRRLVVEVQDHAWRRELLELGHQIVRKLNEAVGKNVLAEIDFRVKLPAPRPPHRAMTADGVGEPADEVSGIEDPQWRRLYRASKKRAET